MSDEETQISAEVVRALEGILLVAMEPVDPTLLAQLLEQPLAVVEGLCERLSMAYAEAGHGFQLVKVAGGYRFQSHPDVSAYVERFVLDSQQARISSAALETQVASIRGVDPDAVMRTLQARGYITEVSRDDGPGQAILFGTTAMFLERLGLDSLASLPPIADFVPPAEVVEALEQGLRIVPANPMGASRNEVEG